MGRAAVAAAFTIIFGLMAWRFGGLEPEPRHPPLLGWAALLGVWIAALFTVAHLLAVWVDRTPGPSSWLPRFAVLVFGLSLIVWAARRAGLPPEPLYVPLVLAGAVFCFWGAALLVLMTPPRG